MAFTSMKSGNTEGLVYKVLSKMKDGESITGYLTKIVQNRNYPEQNNLVLETEDGKTVIEFASSGDLRYLISDAIDPNNHRELYLNVLTRIVKTGHRVTKSKKLTTTGDILQDLEQVKEGKEPVSIKGIKAEKAGPASSKSGKAVSSTTAKPVARVEETDEELSARAAEIVKTLNAGKK